MVGIVPLPTTIGLIWTQAKQGVIGAHGRIPWTVPETLEVLRAVTSGHPVIMGRRAWDAFPPDERIVPGRRSIVLTRNDDWAAPGAMPVRSFDEALAAADADEVWVVGGAQMFSEAVGLATRAVVTELDHIYNGDAYAPGLGSEWSRITADPADGWKRSGSGIGYRTLSYSKGAS
jgi:Dihydrofolate reductase